MAKTLEQVAVEYSYYIGVLKSIKNTAVAWLPAFIFFLANVPAEYSLMVAPVLYFLKNMYEIKTGNKLF